MSMRRWRQWLATAWLVGSMSMVLGVAFSGPSVPVKPLPPLPPEITGM